MKLKEVFETDPFLIGMIHLTGKNPKEKIENAIDEIKIFRAYKVDGALVENYHGTETDVIHTLKAIKRIGLDKTINIGVNILPKERTMLEASRRALELANDYDLSFVQFDYVSGVYEGSEVVNQRFYDDMRALYPKLLILGGVWPKYYTPISGSNLEDDIIEGMKRADAIVITGEETGQEVSLEKIESFKKTLGEFPCVIGAGLTQNNLDSYLYDANGGIIGTSLKKLSKTDNKVDPLKVKEVMECVEYIRNTKKNVSGFIKVLT